VSTFLTGALAGYGIAIPVGPIAVLIIQVGIRCGWACAASAAAGAAVADLTFAVAAVLGGAAIAGLIESVEGPFRILSAAILFVMAVSVYLSSRRDRPAAASEFPNRREYAGTFAKFLGLTIVNPPTVIYFVAFIVGLGLADDLSGGQGVAFAAGAFLASLSWQLVLATTGSVAGNRLSGNVQQVTGIIGSLIVAGMAVAILVR
jgi:arginine exporter protein ArgO